MCTGIVDLHVSDCVGGVVAVLANKALHHLVRLHVTLQVAPLLCLVGTPARWECVTGRYGLARCAFS